MAKIIPLNEYRDLYLLRAGYHSWYRMFDDYFSAQTRPVFSIPKRLRIYFMYDRKLLAKLSKCGWNVIRAFLKSAAAYDGAVAGASIAVQTYGDFLNFNPHLHAIVSDGCFNPDGAWLRPARP